MYNKNLKVYFLKTRDNILRNNNNMKIYYF